MYTTGIQKIDELVKGIPAGKSVLILGSPGTPESVFSQQITHARLKQGKQAAYLTNDKRPSALLKMFASIDLSVEKFSDFRVVDSYSQLIGVPSPDAEVVQDPTSLASIDASLNKIISTLSSGALIAIDSLSTLFEICQSQDLQKLSEWITSSTKAEINLLATFINWDYDASFLDKLKGLFDMVIELKSVGDRVILKDFFSVTKASWINQLPPVSVPFTVIKPGGIRVFIPKIIVTGPFNAGKTSFVRSISSKGASADRLGTTVALDHGFVDYRGFSADLFGTPGQERFNPIIKLLGHEALGVIVVVDATDPASFERAKEMLKISHTEGLPQVIAANKSNLEGAVGVEEIKSVMGDIPIIPTTAEGGAQENKPCSLRREDVLKVLDALFDRII